jgi:hypothetical protein
MGFERGAMVVCMMGGFRGGMSEVSCIMSDLPERESDQ